MQFDELDEDGRNFLLNVYRQTKGDPSVKVSMYAIGSEMGFDKPATSRLAEDLMGVMMLEIRTLSGDIGITPVAVAEIEAAGFGESETPGKNVRLGDEPIVSSEVRKVVEQTLDDIKQRVGRIGLSFDALGDLMADLKTVSAQLESSRPKSPIVRECFRSMKQTLEQAGARDWAGRVADLLGE